MAPSNQDESDLIRDLRVVWGRRVTRIDGDRRAKLPPLGELTALDALVESSPWQALPRGRATMLLLKNSVAYVEAGSDSAAVRRQVTLLFGLDDKWERYSRDELAVKAQTGVAHLERMAYEKPKQWRSRERTWRDKLYAPLAKAAMRYAAAEFRILPDEAHPLVLIPDDAHLPPVLMAGRDEVLARLEASTAKLILVTGQPGIGKTSVALALIQRVSPTFLDGVIQVNMNGFGPEEPLSAAAAMGTILARIGYANDYLPSDTSALQGLYRGVMLDRKVLVFLDNVSEPAVVSDLLLPAGPAKFVVTSRRSLAALRGIAEVDECDLQPLSAGEASALLRSKIGDERAAEESEDFNWLVEICQGVPFPLAILGGRLSSRSTASLRSARQEIEKWNHPLHERLPNSRVSTQSIIEWSLDGLSPDADQGLFALVGVPIPHWDQDIFSYLGINGARNALDDLIDDHLVAEAANQELKVMPLIGWAVVEQQSKRPTVDEEAKHRLAKEASNFVARRTLDLRRGDNYRRFGRTNGYAYLADPRPLLPFGALPERDDEFEAALENCRSLLHFAYHRRDPNDLVALAGASHELSLRRGDLRGAVDSASLWKQGIMALRSANNDEVLGPVIEAFFRTFANTSRFLGLHIVRSGQRELLPYLAQMTSGDKEAERIVSELDHLICADGWKPLFDLLAEFGSIPSLYVADRPPFTTKLFRELAKNEVASLVASREGDQASAKALLQPLLQAAWDGVRSKGTVELLWSFEPPLMRLASLEAGQGNKKQAAEILNLVARLYGSNAARGWAGSVLRFADSLGVQIRPTK